MLSHDDDRSANGTQNQCESCILRESEERYRTLFHASPLGFLHIDGDGCVTDCNSAFLRIIGAERGQMIGERIGDSETNADLAREAMNAVNGALSRYDGTFASIDGSRDVWIRATFSPVKSDEDEFLGAVGIIEDITESKRAEEKIRFFSSYDVLTGLLNRRAGEEAMKAANLAENLPICVMYGDSNGLKLANDAFGHTEGDRLLKSTSDILRDVCGDGVICRWGGDEFIIMLTTTGESEAQQRCDAIKSKCREWNGDGFIRPSISLGFAVKTSPEQIFDDVMKDAEESMYITKLRESRKTRLRTLGTLETRLHSMINGAMGRRCRRMLMWCDWAWSVFELSSKEKSDLRHLCQFHDIGMLACSDELLMVTRKMSEEETIPIYQHPAVGYRIARSIPEITHVAELILSHHERWDGTGYPNMTKGAAIPYLSRLLSIFDSLEAMLNFRAYASRMTLSQAIGEIESCAGSQYDPGLVEVILTKLKESPPAFVVDPDNGTGRPVKIDMSGLMSSNTRYDIG